MTDMPPEAPSAAPARKPTNPVRQVWMVLRRRGLQRLPAGEVADAIADGKGRRANDRDLAVAGITHTEED